MFVDLVGVTKAQGSVEYPMLEYCIREDLKLKVKRMMAILDPVKLVIDNYPEDQVEYMDVANNQENPEMGTRKVPFTKELYIEREDFMEEPPKKYFRLFPGNEVRLMHAYFVKCESFAKDENGKVSSYTVDLKKCMFCGNCEYYCPKGAIKLTQEYELATDDIDELVLKYNGGCND